MQLGSYLSCSAGGRVQGLGKSSHARGRGNEPHKLLPMSTISSNPADNIALQTSERKGGLADETIKVSLLYEEVPAFQALAPNE